jgi:aminocarboxymuconate-semialdehyde decarboxylase
LTRPPVRPVHDARAVDIHAHHLGRELATSIGGDPDAPRLVIDDEVSGRIMCGEQIFRKVGSMLWDVHVRLAEMERAGISHQVLSPVPVTMEHAWTPKAGLAYARLVNDSIVAACEQSDGRLIGLGCLPFEDMEAALMELARCLQMGLRGVEIGTRIGVFDLDAPELDRFWAACESEGAAVFVHPIQGGQGVVRRAGQLYDLGLGMLTDTAIAAASLVFGGVLARYPAVRIALAHGCGAFPWAYPRLAVAAHLAAGGDPAEWDALTRRLYADSLVFDDEHLRLLVHRFGADRILLGSDAPFFPDQMRKSMHGIDRAREDGCVPAHLDHGLLARNALEFLALTD